MARRTPQTLASGWANHMMASNETPPLTGKPCARRAFWERE
jgi:hypothetical protein